MSVLWQSTIPVPVDDVHPEYIEFYNFAWELAHQNIKELSGMPQTPFIKEGYIDFYVWIWDTCLMSLYTKYSQKTFPGYQTLRNFYEVLQDGRRLPDMKVASKPFPWLEQNVGDIVPILISLADNPPIFAWAEYENALFHGDSAHLRTLLNEKKYLQKHFRFFDSFKAPGEKLYGCDQPTSVVSTPRGYHWGGFSSGMDNSPRGRLGEHVIGKNPDNADMLWVDAIAQQGLSALLISRMAEMIGETSAAEYWKAEYQRIKEIVNSRYWDEQDGFYYDISAKDGHFYKVMTPASYWVLLAEMASPERAHRMAEHLKDSASLGGFVPCVSLSRRDPDFNGDDGNYWRGSMWLPLAYVCVKAMEKYEMYGLASELSERILKHMCHTWKKYSPHSIWECYAPNDYKPAKTGNADEVVRKDFCGWSALGPIAMYLENVIGIHTADAFTGTLYWKLPAKINGRIGVKRYRFGGITADLICDGNGIEVNSIQQFTIFVNGHKIEHTGTPQSPKKRYSL